MFFSQFLPTTLACPCAAFAVLLLCVVPQAARAQTTLLSNLEATPSTTSGNGISATSQKAVAFTTGNTAYTLGSVQAYLALNDSTDTIPAVLSFGLYTPSTAGGNLPGNLVASLGTNSVSNVRTTPTVYTFNASSSYVMTANTRYVLLLDFVSGTTSGGVWTLETSNPRTLPTARNNSGYNTPVYNLSNDNGATYTQTSTQFNLFAINAAVGNANTPEPGTLPLLGVGLMTGAGMVGAVKRRKANRPA